jgi:hypothetical protein
LLVAAEADMACSFLADSTCRVVVVAVVVREDTVLQLLVSHLVGGLQQKEELLLTLELATR